MIKYFRLLFIIIIITFVTLSFPASASGPNVHIRQPGETKVLAGGYVATFDKYINNTTEQWTVKLGAQSYLPSDLGTKIDTRWYLQSDGTYKSGNNIYSSVISGEQITVSNNGQNSSWKPTLTVLGGSINGSDWILTPFNPTPELLTVDPLNSNYEQNTLVWHYFNGIDRYMRLIEGQCQEYYILNTPLTKDLTIKHNDTTTRDFKAYKKAIAYDSNLSSVTIDEDSYKNITVKASKVKSTSVVYPLTIDPNYDFTTSASDGYMYGYAASGGSYYSNLLSATDIVTAGGGVVTSATTSWIGTSYSSLSTYYNVDRSAMYFDTSSLSSYTLTAGSIYFYATDHLNADTTSVVVTNGQTLYPHDPMVSTDWNRSNYSGNGGTLALSGITNNAYNSLSLNATGLGWINKSGETKLFFRTLIDYNTGTPTGQNYLTYYSYEQGNGYWPYLSVTYTVIVPTVASVAASNIYNTGARLNGTLTSDGGEASTIVIGYDSVSRGTTFANYATKTTLVGTYVTGNSPYLDVTTLVANTTYYFNIQATNSAGSSIGTELSFTTTNALSNITTMTGYQTDTTISLNWTKASGSQRTAIYYSTTPFGTYQLNSLILNPSFETAVAGNPSNWTNTHGNFAQTTASVKVGTYSAVSTLSSDFTVERTTDTIAVTNGHTYTLGAWIKTNVANKVRISISDSGDHWSSYVAGDNEWHWTTITRTVDQSTIYPYIYIESSTSTTYLDGFKLVEAASLTSDIPSSQSQIYLDSGVNYKLSSLTPGTSYYFVAFGEINEKFSYTQFNLVATTLPAGAGSSTFGVPSKPVGWNNEPSGSKLSSFTPFYPALEAFRADIGMDDGTFWMGATFLIALVAFLGATFMGASGMPAFIAASMVLISGVVLGTVPMVSIFIVALIFLGIVLIARTN